MTTSYTRRPRRRTATALVGVLAVLAALLTMSPTAARAAQTPLPSSVTLVGDLQSELGCPGDWQPDCAKTQLTRVGDSSVFQGRFEVPAGAWLLKVALNGSWDESYGKDGGSDNIPLVLAGAATLDFSYDHTTHRVGITP